MMIGIAIGVFGTLILTYIFAAIDSYRSVSKEERLRVEQRKQEHIENLESEIHAINKRALEETQRVRQWMEYHERAHALQEARERGHEYGDLVEGIFKRGKTCYDGGKGDEK